MRLAILLSALLIPVIWTSTRAAAPAADSSPLIQAIVTAPDPSSAVTAYAKALAGGVDQIAAERAYLFRMTEFGLPEMADAQAQDLILRDPDNGLAWAVAAHMSARRGNMAAAIGQVETAAHRAPENPFVLRTAAGIFAWYDTRGAGQDIPDVIRAPIPDMKKRLMANPAFASAFESALKDYQNAPPAQVQPASTEAPPQTQPTQVAEVYVAPPAYPVASPVVYEQPTVVYREVSNPIIVNSCPTPWWGSPWWGSSWWGPSWGWGFSFAWSNNNCNWNNNWNNNCNWNSNWKNDCNWNGNSWNNKSGGQWAGTSYRGGSVSNLQRPGRVFDSNGHSVLAAQSKSLAKPFVGPSRPTVDSGGSNLLARSSSSASSVGRVYDAPKTSSAPTVMQPSRAQVSAPTRSGGGPTVLRSGAGSSSQIRSAPAAAKGGTFVGPVRPPSSGGASTAVRSSSPSRSSGGPSSAMRSTGGGGRSTGGMISSRGSSGGGRSSGGGGRR